MAFNWSNVWNGVKNFVGGVWRDLTGQTAVAQQNAFNKAESELAYQRQLDVMRMQNEYNSPSQQIQRLKDAGLNTNLVYGSSASTGNTSTSSPAYHPAAMQALPSGIQQLQTFGALADTVLGVVSGIKDIEAKKTAIANAQIKGEGLTLSNRFLSQSMPFRLDYWIGKGHDSKWKWQNYADDNTSFGQGLVPLGGLQFLRNLDYMDYHNRQQQQYLTRMLNENSIFPLHRQSLSNRLAMEQKQLRQLENEVNFYPYQKIENMILQLFDRVSPFLLKGKGFSRPTVNSQGYPTFSGSQYSTYPNFSY